MEKEREGEEEKEKGQDMSWKKSSLGHQEAEKVEEEGRPE